MTRSSGPSCLRVEAVSYRYGKQQALDELDLEVHSGELLSLLGPNGAGKTTLLEILCGLRQPDAGRIRSEVDRAQIGYAPQALLVWPALTVREQLVLMGEMYQSGDVGARADSLIESLGLADKAHARAAHLSGGMQRRLNLGLALMHQPRLLLLDEPTVGLDPVQRTRVHSFLRGLTESGTTLLWSTHDLEEADRLSDRVAIIDRGRILAVETAATLRERASRPESARLEDAFLDLTGRRFD